MPVDILMATYNGGRYLRNQLLSLQQQTYEDWTLWVRDDGSTDNTLNILGEFSESDKRINIVEEQAGKRFGPGKNFLGLTKYATSDYAIFCDQDDIWFEKKLEILIEFAEANFDPGTPCLVYCDAYGYSDLEGIIIIDSIYRNPPKNLNDFLFSNSGYHGSSILFNKSLYILAANYKPNFFYLHDDIVSLLAHVFGRVYFLPKKLMLWRLHPSNVTGNLVSTQIYIKRVFNRKLFVLDAEHYKEIESFYNAYKNNLDNDTNKLFKAFIDFPNKAIHMKIFYIIYYKFSIGGSKLKLILKTIVRRPIG